MRSIRKAAPWLLGVVFASVFFVVLWQTASFYYTGSDDSPILQAFMGYEGGVPATFHLYTHTVLAWLLWALARVFPGIAWFSVLQVALLWLSAVLLVKSPAQLSRRHGKRLADEPRLAIHGNIVELNGKIDAVVHVGRVGAAVAHAALVRVAFIRNNQRGAHGAGYRAALLLMVAHGGDNLHGVGHRHTRVLEDGKEHYRAVGAVVVPIDAVAHIMPPAHAATGKLPLLDNARDASAAQNATHVPEGEKHHQPQ